MRAAALLLALAGLAAVAAAQGELPKPVDAVADDPFAYPEMIIRAEGEASGVGTLASACATARVSGTRAAAGGQDAAAARCPGFTQRR